MSQKYAIVAILSVALLFSMTSSVYAQSENDLPEPGTTPDSFVYGFKKAFEGLSLAFTFSENDKVAKHLEFAELRLAEAKAVSEKGMPEFVDELAKDYEKQISEASKIASLAQDASDKESLMELIDAATSKHISILQNVMTKVPEQAKTAIQNAIEKSQSANESMTKGDEHQQEGKDMADDKKPEEPGTDVPGSENKENATSVAEEKKQQAEEKKQQAEELKP